MEEVALISNLIKKVEKSVKKVEKTFREDSLLVKIENNTFLNNHWEYKVGFHFKDALDIKFTERVKEEFKRKKNPNDYKRENESEEEYKIRKKRGIPRPKEHMENYWSQGIFINFKEGDTFHHKNGKSCIQIKKAIPTILRNDGVLSKGTVVFYEYSINENGKYKLVNIDSRKHCTQIEFLKLLITGNKLKIEKEGD